MLPLKIAQASCHSDGDFFSGFTGFFDHGGAAEFAA
jgi:hypothetical protein